MIQTAPRVWYLVRDFDVGGHFYKRVRGFEELFHLGHEEVKGKTDHYLPVPPDVADGFRANDLLALREDRAVDQVHHDRLRQVPNDDQVLSLRLRGRAHRQ